MASSRRKGDAAQYPNWTTVKRRPRPKMLRESARSMKSFVELLGMKEMMALAILEMRSKLDRDFEMHSRAKSAISIVSSAFCAQRRRAVAAMLQLTLSNSFTRCLTKFCLPDDRGRRSEGVGRSGSEAGGWLRESDVDGGGTGRGRGPVVFGMGAVRVRSGVKQGPDVGAVWGAGMGREPEGEGVAFKTAGDGV